MIIDHENLYSEDQAITASAASTNLIDHGAAAANGLGTGSKLEIAITVTEAFATLTSLTMALEQDDNSGFSSAATVATTGAIAVASLTLGSKHNLVVPPGALTEQYSRMYYTVGGSNATAGKVHAGIVYDSQFEH